MNRFLAILVVLAVPLAAFGQGLVFTVTNYNGVVSTRSSVSDSGIFVGKAKRTPAEAEHNIKRANGKVKQLKHTGLMIVDFGKNGNGHEKAKQLVKNGTMKYLYPDKTLTIDTTPDDTLWASQWDMVKIDAPTGWNVSTGTQDIVVAIIDTGLWMHPDLTNNIWTDPGSGAHGWTCLGGVLTEGVTDGNGHGTHCAGTIGAVGNNALGVAGVNWKVKMAGFRFLDTSGGGSLSDVLNLIDKIIELKSGGVNIKITSNSWGARGTDSALRDAFQSLEEAGILNVIAAGNSTLNMDVYPVVPGGLTNRGIICVQATDSNDLKAGFSNYGLASTDIGAPGVGILSTMMTNAPHSDPSGYGLLSGTSMACPHVAGLAALALSVNPSLTVYELKTLILNHDSLDTITGLGAQSTTSGRINVYKTLTNPDIITPVENHDPTNVVTAPVTVTGGDLVTITNASGDIDGDTVTTSIGSMDGFFPTTITNKISFTAPVYGADFVSTFTVAAIDGNGGAKLDNGYINIDKQVGLTPAPFAIETCFDTNTWATTIKHAAGSDTNYSAYFKLFMTTPVAITTLGDYATYPVDTICQDRLGTWVHQTVTNGPANNTFSLYAMAMNSQGTMAKSDPVYIRWGTHTNLSLTAPTISVVLTNNFDTAPATVGYDLTGSTDADGTVVHAFVGLASENYTAFVPLSGSLLFDTPGSYRMSFIVQDNDGFYTQKEQYVIVKSNGTNQPPPIAPVPSLRILTRMSGYNVRGNPEFTAPPAGTNAVVIKRNP